MKPWVLYIILAWQLGPLAPEEQKTITLQFDHASECTSVAAQVDAQVKAEHSIFRLKEVRCMRCTDLYGPERCTATKKR